MSVWVQLIIALVAAFHILGVLAIAGTLMRLVEATKERTQELKRQFDVDRAQYAADQTRQREAAEALVSLASGHAIIHGKAGGTQH